MIKATLNGITYEFNTPAEAHAFSQLQLGQAPSAMPSTPRRHLPLLSPPPSHNNKAAQASLTYDYVVQHPGSRPETMCASIQRTWADNNLVTTRGVRRRNKKTKRLQTVSRAGDVYSLNSVRPWVFAARAAIEAGMTRSDFVAQATAKGSKVGNSVAWKPKKS